MSYATPADMLARYGEATMVGLSDLTRRGVIEEATVQLALDDATAEIDGYLNRYRRPFATVPRILTVYCCDIARYRLATGLRQLTNDIQARYDAAIGYLKLVARGQAGISGLPLAGEVDTVGAVVMQTPPDKVFGRDKPC